MGSTPSQIPYPNHPKVEAKEVPSSLAHKRLGEILVDNGWVEPSDIDLALEESKKTGQYIGAVLIKRGKITKEQIGKALTQQFDIQYISLTDLEIDKNLIKLLPKEFMRENQVIPVAKEGGKLVVAMVRPNDRRVHDEITFITGMRPQAYVTTSLEFQEVLGRFLQEEASETLMHEISSISSTTELSKEDLIREQQMAEIMDTSNPLVKLVNSIIEEAIEKDASDIHVEARKNRLIVRFRMDGILQSVLEIPQNMQGSFITRIKVMSRMDIAEHRRPQDGRITFTHQDTEYNLRVNSLPVGEGKEKVVIRILRPSKNITDFTDLGFVEEDIKKLEVMYKSPYGIVLVCGPTGSGKTTTLYTVLHKINEDIRNISTVEDPIELQIEGLNQSQVNHKADFTFASALRSLLRQDPDVIMVGEIRDYETLESSIHASLTGHLVFSTVHANTTAATVTRLIEMGADASMISSALLGVVAQRLVRTLCDHCKQPYQAGDEEKQRMFPKNPDYQKKDITLHQPNPEGCSSCNYIGYSGRAGLYEIMVVNRQIRQQITAKKSDLEIEDTAIASGMRTLNVAGVKLLLQGRTSLDELTRVLGVNLGRTL